MARNFFLPNSHPFTVLQPVSPLHQLHSHDWPKRRATTLRVWISNLPTQFKSHLMAAMMMICFENNFCARLRQNVAFVELGPVIWKSPPLRLPFPVVSWQLSHKRRRETESGRFDPKDWKVTFTCWHSAVQDWAGGGALRWAISRDQLVWIICRFSFVWSELLKVTWMECVGWVIFETTK